MAHTAGVCGLPALPQISQQQLLPKSLLFVAAKLPKATSTFTEVNATSHLNMSLGLSPKLDCPKERKFSRCYVASAKMFQNL